MNGHVNVFRCAAAVAALIAGACMMFPAEAGQGVAVTAATCSQPKVMTTQAVPMVQTYSVPGTSYDVAATQLAVEVPGYHVELPGRQVSVAVANAPCQDTQVYTSQQVQQVQTAVADTGVQVNLGLTDHEAFYRLKRLKTKRANKHHDAPEVAVRSQSVVPVTTSAILQTQASCATPTLQGMESN